LIEATWTLLDRLGPGLDVKGVLGKLLEDARHFYRSPHKNVLVVLEEVDELAILFGAQVGPDLDGLGRVPGINLHGIGIFGDFEGVECRGHDRAG
jgi:hypothetical protein